MLLANEAILYHQLGFLRKNKPVIPVIFEELVEM